MNIILNILWYIVLLMFIFCISFGILFLVNQNKKYKIIKDTDIVYTDDGDIIGQTLNNGTERFLGIPYAKAPLGELRFRNPQPIDSRNDIFYAVKRSSDPIQVGKSSYSEDCLYLNIYRPTEYTDQKLPVIIFVYGGSYEVGGTNMYDFELMSKETNSIIVSFNYRVNVFGFLNFSDLSDKFDNNLGLKDAILAIKWIHDNIEYFNGDNQNVTLCGQSAGAGLISCLLMNEEIQNYYSKAILMSCCWESVYSPSQAEEIRNDYMELLGIEKENVEQLLKLESNELLSVVKELNDYKVAAFHTLFSPIADGEIFATPPTQANLSRIKKPIIIGTTKDEATLFVYNRDEKEVLREYTGSKILPYATKEQVSRIINTYNNLKSKDDIVKIATDVLYKVPSSRFADEYSKYEDIYFYRFDYSPFVCKLMKLKACHGIDLATLLGNKRIMNFPFFMFNNYFLKKVGNEFRTYIKKFAYIGNPNIDKYGWKKYDEVERKIYVFDKKSHLESNPYKVTLEKYRDLPQLVLGVDK